MELDVARKIKKDYQYLRERSQIFHFSFPEFSVLEQSYAEISEKIKRFMEDIVRNYAI